MPLNFGGVRVDGTQALSSGSEPVGSHYFGQSSFASHALVNQRNAIKVRENASLKMLGPLGCRVQTGAGSIKGTTKGDVDPAQFMPRMVELYMEDKFPFDKLVTLYPLADINRAVTEQHEDISIKPVLTP